MKFKYTTWRNKEKYTIYERIVGEWQNSYLEWGGNFGMEKNSRNRMQEKYQDYAGRFLRYIVIEEERKGKIKVEAEKRAGKFEINWDAQYCKRAGKWYTEKHSEELKKKSNMRRKSLA